MTTQLGGSNLITNRHIPLITDCLWLWCHYGYQFHLSVWSRKAEAPRLEYSNTRLTTILRIYSSLVPKAAVCREHDGTT